MLPIFDKGKTGVILVYSTSVLVNCGFSSNSKVLQTGRIILWVNTSSVLRGLGFNLWLSFTIAVLLEES